MKAKNRKSFTLLELLISLTLFAIMLGIFFKTFVDEKRGQQKVKAIREEVFKRQKCHIRLHHFIDNIAEKFIDETTSLPKFYNNDEGLFITFDNGLNIEPKLCGIVAAHLFLDDEHNFAVRIFQSDAKDKESSEKEIFLQNVAKLRFEFFHEDQKLKKLIWKSSWSKTNSTLPIMLKIEIEQLLGEKLSFIFSLPQSHPQIIYDTAKES